MRVRTRWAGPFVLGVFPGGRGGGLGGLGLITPGCPPRAVVSADGWVLGRGPESSQLVPPSARVPVHLVPPLLGPGADTRLNCSVTAGLTKALSLWSEPRCLVRPCGALRSCSQGMGHSSSDLKGREGRPGVRAEPEVAVFPVVPTAGHLGLSTAVPTLPGPRPLLCSCQCRGPLWSRDPTSGLPCLLGRAPWGAEPTAGNPCPLPQSAHQQESTASLTTHGEALDGTQFPGSKGVLQPLFPGRGLTVKRHPWHPPSAGGAPCLALRALPPQGPPQHQLRVCADGPSQRPGTCGPREPAAAPRRCGTPGGGAPASRPALLQVPPGCPLSRGAESLAALRPLPPAATWPCSPCHPPPASPSGSRPSHVLAQACVPQGCCVGVARAGPPPALPECAPRGGGPEPP